ncbi:MAG: ABC transporter substrate-binding protein [Candidatus Limnocylindrus sp.]
MSTTRSRIAIGQTTRMAVVVMAMAMFMAACGGSTATPTSSADASCVKETLALKNAGELLIGTDNPAYSPWFQGGNDGADTTPWTGDYNNDPSKGQGYEGAVAYAIAEQLGFTPEQVTWVVTTFDQALAPGEKGFDIYLAQVSIKPERAEAVDFSSGYYDAAQGVVTIEGSPIAGATSIADLKTAKLGAQIGTTSLDAINNVIKPDTEVAVFNTNDEAVAALEGGLVDGIVTDVPTAFYMRDAQLTGGIIVGQLPSDGSAQEQFGMVLEKGSALTACVSAAVNALKADGTLAALLTEWIADKASAPVLK